MPIALVTGGTGFLGSHIGAALTEAGWDVRLLDRNPPSNPLGPRQEFIRADIRDEEAMARATRSCEVVVDNAALVPVTRSSPAEYRSVNVGGCKVTLDAARAEGAYVVHVSSSSIYGRPGTLPITEDTPLLPFEPYGQSKAEAERLVHDERRAGLVVASLRPRAILGSGRLGLFDIIFARIRAGKTVPLFGRGANRIQMCDARDFMSAVVAAIEHRANDDYNIGTAIYGTVRDDLDALIRRVGSPSRLRPVPTWAIRAVLQPLHIVGRSPFSPWHWHSASDTFFASLDKAERELGWSPRYSNVDALTYAYEEYLTGAAGTSPHTSPLRGLFARMLRG